MTGDRSNFYVTGGTLQFDAPSYVERSADQDLLENLLHGEFCYVLTARQMGKSSLMVRTAGRLRQAGIQVAALDLTAIGGQNISPDQWYHGLLDTLAQSLDLEDELENFWQTHADLGPLHRFMKALRQIVLNHLDRSVPPNCNLPSSSSVRLVVFIDEIDFVRSLPFTVDEFFASIRECYNRRTMDPAYRQVTFCLLGVASPSDLIRDTRTTPFNIGRRIELNDFTTDEAAPLAAGLRSRLSEQESNQSQALLDRVLYWTAGHPYLTQKLCRVTAEFLQSNEAKSDSLSVPGPEVVDRICSDLFLSHRARERDDNLIFVRERLLRNEVNRADLLDFYSRIWRGRHVLDDELDPLVNVLRLSGVIRVSNGELQQRNRIYSQVFDLEWIRSNMPEADLRRQREAYRRGLAWATSISLVIVSIMSWLVIRARHESNRERIASAKAYFLQAQTQRTSSHAGQRIESLKALARAKNDYTNMTELRNEAISCLALVDLESIKSSIELPADATAFSTDSQATGHAWADPNQTVKVRDVHSQNILLEITNSESVAWANLSPGSKYLAIQTVDLSGKLRIWNVHDGTLVLTLTNRFAPRAVDFAPDNSAVAMSSASAGLLVYKLPTGTLISSSSIETTSGLLRDALCISFDPQGKRIAEASANSGQIFIYDLYSGAAPVALGNHRSACTLVSWHPDGEHLAVASEHRDIYLWDLSHRKFSEITQAHSEAITDLTFDHRGDLLATIGADATVKLWIATTRRQVVAEFEGGGKGRLYFSEKDEVLSFFTPTGEGRFWAVENSKEYRVLQANSGTFIGETSLAFDNSGQTLITGSDIGINLWDTQSGKELASIPVRACRASIIDPVYGHLFASTGIGFYRWPCVAQSSQELKLRQYGPPHPFNLPVSLGSTAFSPAGRLSSILHDGHVHLADLDNPNSSTNLAIPGKFNSLALSATGDWLATWKAYQSRLTLWKIDRKNSRASMGAETDSTSHYAFSPDGAWIITNWKQHYRAFNLTNWQSLQFPILIPRLGEHCGTLALASIRDSKRCILATTTSTTIIKLYQIAFEGDQEVIELASLESPDRKPIIGICLSPNATYLAATTSDQTVELWDLASIQAKLSSLRLAGPLQALPRDGSPSLRVFVDPAPIDSKFPEKWQTVERHTSLLSMLPENQSYDRLKTLLSRGQLYLSMDLNHEAYQDFAAALRIKPDDETLRTLQHHTEQLIAKELKNRP